MENRMKTHRSAILYLEEEVTEEGKIITISFNRRNDVRKRKVALIYKERKRKGFLKEQSNDKGEKNIVASFEVDDGENGKKTAAIHLERNTVIGFLEEIINEKDEKVTYVYPNQENNTLVKADDCMKDINIENSELIKYVYLGVDEKGQDAKTIQSIEDSEKINVCFRIDENEYDVEDSEKVTYLYLDASTDENKNCVKLGQSDNSCEKNTVNRLYKKEIPVAYLYKQIDKDEEKIMAVYLSDRKEEMPVAYFQEEINGNGEKIPVAYIDKSEDKNKGILKVYLHRNIEHEKRSLQSLAASDNCITDMWDGKLYFGGQEDLGKLKVKISREGI